MIDEKHINWVEKNLKNIECTLCWSSDGSILNYNGKHIFFHTVDRTLLYLLAAVIKHNKKGVLVYPVDERKIIIPLCVEALYSLYPKNNGYKVLLISQNLAIRELYWNMQANSMLLNKVFPLGIVKLDGSIKPQLKSTQKYKINGEKCKFIHTSNPRFLPEKKIINDVGCFVIDTHGLDWSDLQNCIEWGEKNNIKSLIFLSSNPYSEKFKLFKSLKIPIWGWNTNSLYADFKNDLNELKANPNKYNNPFSFSVFQIKNWLEGINREFFEMKDHDVIIPLNESLKLYFNIKNICNETKSKVLSESLISFISCKYSFERMLSPLNYTEQQCRLNFFAKTLESRIKMLETLQKIISLEDHEMGEYWSKTIALTKDIYKKFHEKGNPKYFVLKKIINKSIKNNEKIIIFSYNKPNERALIESLKNDMQLDEDDINQQGIFINSIDRKYNDQDYDKCIVFGQIPFRASWLLRTACAKNIIFLVYPSEKALLKQQFENEEKKFSSVFKEGSRISFLKEITNENKLKYEPPKPEFAKKNIFSLKLSQSEAEDEKLLKPLLKDIIIDDDLVFEEDYGMGDIDDESMDPAISKTGEIVTKCCKITLEDGKSIYFKENRKLPIFKNGKKLEYLDVTKVKEGELLIIIKNNIRNNLAREIINCADKHPKMQKLKFLVNCWVMALRKGLQENNDAPNDFLIKLNKIQDLEGAPRVRSSLTIQLWKEGYVIGPRDTQNIKYIGKIYNEEFLVKHYKEIGLAISRLRGIHQKLLRDFNELVVKAGLKTFKSDSDEIIDEEFNLHLEDFIGIISIDKIKKIEYNFYTERKKLDRILRE